LSDENKKMKNEYKINIYGDCILEDLYLLKHNNSLLYTSMKKQINQ